MKISFVLASLVLASVLNGVTAHPAHATPLGDGMYRSGKKVYYVLSGKKLRVPKAKAYNVILTAAQEEKIGTPISNSDFILLRKPCGNVSLFESEECAKKWADVVDPFAKTLLGKFVIEVEHLGELHYVRPMAASGSFWDITEIEPLTLTDPTTPWHRDHKKLYQWFKNIGTNASKEDLAALPNL